MLNLRHRETINHDCQRVHRMALFDCPASRTPSHYGRRGTGKSVRDPLASSNIAPKTPSKVEAQLSSECIALHHYHVKYVPHREMHLSHTRSKSHSYHTVHFTIFTFHANIHRINHRINHCINPRSPNTNITLPSSASIEVEKLSYTTPFRPDHDTDSKPNMLHLDFRVLVPSVRVRSGNPNEHDTSRCFFLESSLPVPQISPEKR